MQDLLAWHDARADHGSQFRAGLLLPTGTSEEYLTADVLAVPWWRLL